MPNAKNAIHNKTWAQSNLGIERVRFNGVSILSSSCYLNKKSGLEIATDTVANATNIFSLATKNSGLVAKVATRF